MFDTNVLISAFLFGKKLTKILNLIDQGIVVPCFVIFTFQEFQNVLQYSKFHQVLEKANTTVAEITSSLHSKSLILDNPSTTPNVVGDFLDNNVLATARLARAEYIVTGDKELLDLNHFQGIPILSAKQFLSMI